MRQVRKIAVCILMVIAIAPLSALAAQDNYEIDLKDLGPAKAKPKPQVPPQPSTPATGEIDLKELRKIAPPQTAKPTQHKRRSQTAAAPEAAPSAASGQESIYVVQPGEHLYQILMKQYGLSDPAAERLVPEIMRLNGITSPKGLKVGQRLRIPLPAREGKQSASASVSGKKSHRPAPVAVPQPAVSVPAPATALTVSETTVQTAAAVPAQTTKPAEPPALVGSISIVSASPCKLAHDMAEKMGLLAASPTGILGVETVGAVYAGRSVTAVCGLSKAELYTYERLLARNGKQLLVFDEDEADESVVEELADSLGLVFHKRDAEAEELPLTYIFAPFGSWSQEVQLTILPAQADTDPPAANKP
jgi:LysM repeat protein